MENNYIEIEFSIWKRFYTDVNLNDYEINSEDDIEDIIYNSYDSEFLLDTMEALYNTEVFHNDKLIWRNGKKVE